MHLSVILEDTAKVDTPKIDTNTQKIILPPIPLEPEKVRNITYTYLSSFAEIGVFKVKNSPSNQLLDSTISSWRTNTYGFNFEVLQKRFFYSTGVQMTNFFEEFSLEDKWETIDSSIFTNVDVYTYWNVDTVWFLNLDSLLVGDTVWVPYYDSTQINEYDTSYITNYDTTKHYLSYNKFNKMKYLEVPIIFGFQFGNKKWKYSIKTGLIAGFLVSYDYKIALPRNEGILEGNFVKYSFWSYTNLNIQYEFSDRFSVNLGIYGRIPLNNQMLIFDTNRRYYSYGFTFGIKMRINN